MLSPRSCLPILTALMLCACTVQAPAPVSIPAPVSEPVPAGTPDTFRWYRTAKEPVYRIDPAHSLIAITVRRGGPFARFGHDHVMASRSVQGYAAPRTGRADFGFRLDELTVDEPGLRKLAQLDTEPSADAIAGTRANMLTKVLDAERFPRVELHAQRVPKDPASVKLTITLHGVTRDYLVPTTIESASGTLSASGELTVLQTDFGITPMSVLGGAIKVEDPLQIRFTVVARLQR